MKIFLLEYITAGGFNKHALPKNLLQEALLMRDALLRDFGTLSDVEVFTTYDVRLSKPNIGQALSITSNEDAFSVWRSLLADCDLALVVAPETDYILTELTQMLIDNSIPNLGCKLPAVVIASNKFDTYNMLKDAGILTIETFMANVIDTSFFKHTQDGFIAKPAVGAGCEKTFYFQNLLELKDWLADSIEQPNKIKNMVVQRYIMGQPASISALFKDGKAWLLSNNTQKVSMQVSKTKEVNLKYSGSVVNVLPEFTEQFTVLANKIANALPDLNGFAGIDVIISNKEIYVVEINPRITTSYIVLGKSLSINPAALILKLATNENFKLPESMTNHSVTVDLDE